MTDKCMNEVPCKYNNWNHKCGDVCGYDVDDSKKVVLCEDCFAKSSSEEKP